MITKIADVSVDAAGSARCLSTLRADDAERPFIFYRFTLNVANESRSVVLKIVSVNTSLFFFCCIISSCSSLSVFHCGLGWFAPAELMASLPSFLLLGLYVIVTYSHTL